MIAKMTKYSILLLGSDKDAILSQIRDLGLLDITRSAKPIDKHSEALLQEIRDALDSGTFAAYKKRMLEQLNGDGD